MITDNEKDKLLSFKKMSDNKDFYNNVFKRTESILSVVFYILTFLQEKSTAERFENHITEKAFLVHEHSLATLDVYRYEATDTLIALRQALVALESSLRVATAAQYIGQDALFIVVTEIDAVIRTINNNYITDSSLPITQKPKPSASVHSPSSSPSTSVQTRAPIVTGHDMSSDAARVQAQIPDRAERIKTVLEAAGEASIKDISDIIRDCSEKTIQRELNSLIEKGEVIRIGERRWSKYSVLNT